LYRELLKLCGFEEEQIDRETHRIDKAFHILEIESKDVTRARNKITDCFDIELVSVRKCLGLWLKEMVDMVLAKEEGKTIVYVSYPPISQIACSLALASDKIYCAAPEIVLSNTFNLMFGKIDPILETAEQHGLTPATAFCSYLQTRLGAIIKGIIPKPDLLICSSFLCDLAPATDQLLHQLYGTPVVYIDNFFDVSGEEWPDAISRRKVEYLATEMRNAMTIFTEVTGYEVTEEKIQEAIQIRNRLNNICNEIQKLRQADAIPLSQNISSIVNSLSSACIKRGLQEGLEALDLLHKEVEERISNGAWVSQTGTPRVIFTMVPHDPSLIKMTERLGLTIVGTAVASTPGGARKSTYSDLWEQVADSLMRGRGANYSSLAYIRQLKELARLWAVDGIIFFRHYSCRQYSILSIKAKEIIESELGIPVLQLEGDYCDFRTYSTEQMIPKIETFAEILRDNKRRMRRA